MPSPLDSPGQKNLHVLILGASYGMLMAIRALAAGHRVTLIGRQDEVELIQHDGIRVELPSIAKGSSLELISRFLPGELDARTPDLVDPAVYDLIFLAMQEPQYADPFILSLMDRIVRSERPCISIMNMPPLSYLKRIPVLAAMELDSCFASPAAWACLTPDQLTMCSPDPQASRPPGAAPNVLRVGLASNFRAAAFTSTAATELLRTFAATMNEARVTSGERRSALPVRLRIHDSVFVPLSKWSMLLAGNYRCIEAQGIRSIRAALLDDPKRSREVYEAVNGVLLALGASPDDLVSFDHYAKAAEHLANPSSAARALAAGATAIERVDRLVCTIATKLGLQTSLLEEIVDVVDRRLAANLRGAA